VKNGIIAIFLEAIDECRFGEPALRPTARQHGNDINGLGNEIAWHGNDSFLDELFEPS